MTMLLNRTTDLRQVSAAEALATAVVAGVALGVLDLLLQTTLPYPLANLANSSAVWAVLAFAFARLVPMTEGLAALAGATMLVVAVEVYYVAAIVVDLASPYSLTSPSTVLWVLFAIVSGAGFGLAGAWVRQTEDVRAVIGLALAGAVLLAEALLRVHQPGTALLTGVLAAGVLATGGRGRSVAAGAALLAIAMTPACYVAFRVAGFGI